jgi:hypothetical protein
MTKERKRERERERERKGKGRERTKEEKKSEKKGKKHISSTLSLSSPRQTHNERHSLAPCVLSLSILRAQKKNTQEKKKERKTLRFHS